MKRYPNTVPAFTRDIVGHLTPDHTYLVLLNMIKSEIESEDLDSLLAKWLARNFRRRGYGGMLEILRKHHKHWERVREIKGFRTEIIQDFERKG